MAEAARKALLDFLKTAPSTGDYSDLIITCGDHAYNVHKVIVCSRSKFFANSQKFDGREAKAAKIELPDDEPSIIKLLIQYFYQAEYSPISPSNSSTPAQDLNDPISSTTTSTRSKKQGNKKERNVLPSLLHTCSHSNCSDYPGVCVHHTCGFDCNYACDRFTCLQCHPPTTLINGSAEQLLVHAKMYEIADKYDVVGLKDLAKVKFDLACQCFWDDANFPIAANHTFSTTPDNDKGLRSIVCKTISRHMSLLKKPEVEAIVIEFNGLAFGLLKEKATEHGWMDK